MKRIISFILAIFLVVSMSITAYAATSDGEAKANGATVLTTTVPTATYVLNIPANTTITYGAERTELDVITVTDAKGFAKGKNLNVTVAYDDFTSDSVETTIPYLLKFTTNITASASDYSDFRNVTKASGDAFTFKGKSDGTVTEKAIHRTYEVVEMYVSVTSEDWGKALAGNYSSTITFASEVVVE